MVAVGQTDLLRCCGVTVVPLQPFAPMGSHFQSFDRFIGLFTVVVGMSGLMWMARRRRPSLKPTSDPYHRGGGSGEVVEHSGACQCERVRFTVTAPSMLRALDCVSKIRYPHVSVSPPSLVVTAGANKLAHLSTQSCGVTSTCYFCSSCGTVQLAAFF